MNLQFPKPVQLSGTAGASGATGGFSDSLMNLTPEVSNLLSRFQANPEEEDDQDNKGEGAAGASAGASAVAGNKPAQTSQNNSNNPTPEIKDPAKEVLQVLEKFNNPDEEDDEEDADTGVTQTPPNPVGGTKPNSQETPTAPATAAPDKPEKPGANASQEEVYAWAKSVPFHEVANLLHESGAIVDVPEGFEVDNVTADNFKTLINHNISVVGAEKFDEGYKAAQESIVNALSPTAYEILKFQLENPNTDEEELKIHIESILYQQDIAGLDPNDPTDAEVIVRQHLASTLPADLIEKEIALAKQHGFLTQRAESYKPLLEQRVQAANKQKALEREQLVKGEQQAYQEFLNKTHAILQSGKIMGIEVGYEDRNKLWGYMNTTKVPVPVPGGKNVEMAYPFYELAKGIYGKDSNPENVLLATMILSGGVDAVKKYLALPVKKEEVTKFRSKSEGGIFKSGGGQGSQQNSQNPQNSLKPKEEAKKAFFSQKL